MDALSSAQQSSRSQHRFGSNHIRPNCPWPNSAQDDSFHTRPTMLAKLRLLGCGAVLGWLLTTSPAAAQAQSDAEKMERLERQVELLQKQLKAVQDEIKATKKKTEKAQAKAIPAVNAATPSPAPTPIS